MRISGLGPFATVFATVLLHYAQAQSTAVSWSAPIDCGESGQGYLRPRIALNGDGAPVVLWGRSSPATNFTAIGQGPMFTEAVPVHPSGVLPAVADWQGSEIAAQGDVLLVTMKATPETSMPMYVVRSTDGGFTWGDTMRVTSSEGPWSRFPNVAFGPDDGAVVQYMGFEPGFLEPHYAVSRMVGDAFEPFVNVSSPFAPGEACDCCPGGIMAEGNTVVSLYRNNGSNERTIWGAVSTDGGVSFPNGAEVDPTEWMINACPSSGPDGIIEGDSVRFVWMSGAVDGSKVFIGSAHLPDLATGEGARLTNAAANLLENYPRIAGHGDTLGVVWQQGLGGQFEILFSWSVTGIGGFSLPDTVNGSLSGAQKTPDIAFANGTFHIVWSDVPAGTVRYRSATLTNTSGIADEGKAGQRPWPVPASTIVHVPGISGRVPVMVTDALGRTFTTAPIAKDMLDVSTWTAGTYLVRSTEGNALRPIRIVVMR